MRLSRVFLLTALVLTLSACSGSDHPSDVDDTASHTVLVYMAAENSLSRFAYSDIGEMLEAKSSLTDNDRLIIYLDNIENPRIYEVTRQTAATSMSALSPVVTFDTERNSASAETLDEILSYTLQHYPADDYSVVFWSHATGWVPTASTGNADADASSSSAALRAVPRRRTFGLDNGKNTSSNRGDAMEIADMATVLAKYPKFRCILFDCCFMQSWEVAYALRDCADYMVGSPAEIPGPGAPYHKVMPLLFADRLDGSAVAQAYNDYYRSGDYGGVVSSVTLSAVDAFAEPLRALLVAKADTLDQLDFARMNNYLDYDTYRSSIYMPDCYDLLSVVSQLASGDELAAWRTRLDALVSCYHDDYWYSDVMNQSKYNIDGTQCSGLSVYLPLTKYADNGEPFASAFFSTAWGSYWQAATAAKARP